MIRKLRKRWLRPKTVGVVIAKLILSSATDLAALTQVGQSIQHGAPQVVVSQLFRRSNLLESITYRRPGFHAWPDNF
jgi:hypothetical protein